MDTKIHLVLKNMLKYNYVTDNKKLNTLVTSKSSHILDHYLLISHTSIL